ncbi:FKBP-type peptidyl-prolyl cis-trans isomerase [Chitinophaga nivalis]|uniref:Peptidyl-prolyl cis-trans isomerase n=1 Tax=Chitinophaga nivalis TaxID=2991709 RepID=A0ABT3ILU7_9BACT|nr:FKBP-type peptidyl-prolyl cis-trans isomerase [Chitinophaga nivalis]MCW3465605.1 FKBP-type peptidyl-prolyl cis-trans isomerase [Chitinophaga nivalis]MCW3484704.1 FKBP-type peptidyl-prolyl cis-trans isomerase [Chitinophaga nivalis]
MKRKNQLLVAALGLLIASCGTGVKKTPGGIEYIVHKSGSGAQLKLGDTALMNVTQRINDSLLGESRKIVGGPIPIVISKPTSKFDLMEGFALLHEGDSATFFIPWDSLPAQERPPFGKKGDKIKITFAVEGTFSASTQKGKDEKEIKSYLEKNKIKATPNAEGVYIAVNQEGTGATPNPGDTVYVHYTGKLTSGKVFDSSQDSTMRPGMPLEPIKFPIGRGFVIKGWDAGLSGLKKGSKATLVIPSTLAYGLQGSPPAIPGNSILVFDVELVDIKAGKAEAPAPAAAPIPTK